MNLYTRVLTFPLSSSKAQKSCKTFNVKKLCRSLNKKNVVLLYSRPEISPRILQRFELKVISHRNFCVSSKRTVSRSIKSSITLAEDERDESNFSSKVHSDKRY